jgi:acyl-CoA synthetase (AMP-forming)/AMP-acid ligase II
MNCVERFSRHSEREPDRCALWLPSGRQASYGELSRYAAAIQAELRAGGVRPGDRVLLMLDLGIELYASVIALMGLGCTTILLEPWLPIRRIEALLDELKPTAFICSFLGRVWASRIRAARSIPVILDPRRASSAGSGSLCIEEVDRERPGILTFTSGTSGGVPKGVVRTQGYLLEQLRVFESNLRPAEVDWCIFANFALANLGLGVTTVVMDRAWSPGAFRAVGCLPRNLRPGSLTCGPAFLARLLDRHGQGDLDASSLATIHVGGALTDVALFEQAFEAIPKAHFSQVYGSTEAEPVAMMDAAEAVDLSRRNGSLQTVALGKPVAEVRLEFDHEGLWVSGPHVCPRYWGNAPENRTHKRTDAAGTLWHSMGDRIRISEDGTLWYSGRSQHHAEDFEAEQIAFRILGHTRAFIHRDALDQRWLLGEGVVGEERALRRGVPGLHGIEDLRIRRDARHRARIDRALTIQEGAPWLNPRLGTRAG